MADTHLTVVAKELRDFAAGLFTGTAFEFDRVMLVAGSPVFDCEQLTVHVANVYSSSPATRPDQRPAKRQVMPATTLVVTTVRCHNPKAGGKTVPKAGVLDDLGTEHTDVGAILYYGLSRAAANGTLFSAIPCGNVKVNPAVPVGPLGDFVGWSLPVEVTL